MRVCMHVCMRVCMCVCMRMCMCACARARMHTHTCTHTHTMHIPYTHLHTAAVVREVRALAADGLLSSGIQVAARVRGRPFSKQFRCYAEQVLYKLPPGGALSQPDGTMGARWLDGTFLGYNRTSRTYRVLTPGGAMIDARSINRLPELN